MGITFSWSPTFAFLSIIIAVGFTIWIYRHTIPPISGFWHFILAFLRSAALILACLIAFGPILHITTKKTREATVGLLIDTSSSMKIRDNGRMRGEMLQNLLRSPELNTLKDRTELRSYFFSDNILPLSEFNPDSIPFDGTATDITQALKALRDERGVTSMACVLLLSDGGHNLGENPVRLSESLGYPIYGVTIGEAGQKPDLILTQSLTNEVTYTGNEVPVEVSLRGPGYGGSRISVQLRMREKILDQRVVTIPPNGLETSLRLNFTPQDLGFQKVTAEISRLEGELTHENNTREFYIRVLKSKLQVLLLANAPSPDLAFLKRLLLADENIHIIARTQKKGGGFYEDLFPPDAELQTLDLFILLDVPSQFTTASEWGRLIKILQQHEKPFLLIAGKEIDIQKLLSIEALLPFYFPKQKTEGLVLPRLTPEGKFHPIVRIDEDWEANAAAWHQLPPLFSSWRFARPKPGCQLLATGISEKFEPSTMGKGFPLIIARHVGQRKSLAFLGHGLYRWDLLMWGVGGTNDVLKGFLSNSIRWLVTREEDKPVRISTNKRIYRAGEEIFFTAQVYDETYHPLERALVMFTLVSPSGEYTLQLADAGNGQYKKTHRVFESGTYRVEGEATLRGRSLGKDEIEFSVSSFNPEFIDTRAHPELMESLARVTGGRSGPPDSLASIVGAMNFQPQTIHSTREIELYSFPWTLALIIVLLSAEWFIRKRKGML